MKNISWMRTAAAVLVVLALCAGVALAQRPDPSQMMEKRMAVMKERLKLTDDQEKKVKTILTDSFKQQMEIRQKYNVQMGEQPSQEAMEAMKKSREDSNKKMSEVLSKEQMEEYVKMQAEMRGPGGEGGGRRGKKQ